ncbi:MAG: hypothetical protein MJZ23_06885 [Paludibacteraceae bacterium]|nr:hypothetical protein [Paludibacteraceae bacterium]
MKKLLILAVSALLLSACGNERSKTFSEYETYIEFQENLTNKVLKGELTEDNYDSEFDKEEYTKIVKAGEDAKHNLLEVKDLLTEKEKSEMADLLLRDKRNHHTLIDAFIEAKNAAKAAKDKEKADKK